MPCNAQLNGAPQAFFGPEELVSPMTTDSVDVPVGASCVTFTFRLCANAAVVGANQVAVEVFWSAAGGAPLSQQTSLQGTATCGEFDTCLAVYNSPEVATGCVVWDLTLPVPAGKNDVQLSVEEVGDPVNPGTLEVWVAFA